MNKISKVKVREKKLKNGKISLYLDFYPPVYNHAKQISTRRESLELYIFTKPRTEQEKTHNKETKGLAESICMQRQQEIQKNAYGIAEYKKGDFLAFITDLKSKEKSRSKRNMFSSITKTLKLFCKKEVIAYTELTKDFAERFRNFLISSDKYTPITKKEYLNNFKYLLNLLHKAELIPSKIEVKNIKAEQTPREYLTKKELEALAKEDCDSPLLKNAFLFSCLTGLRYGDLVNLTFENIKEVGGKTHIVYQQQKTKKNEILPIPDTALKYLYGESNILKDKPQKEKIFRGIRCRTDIRLKIRLWALKAGIDKKLTFHSARHTYATLQLTLGNDIYTVSKLLGHSNVGTTSIYAKIVDEKKRNAVDKMNDLDI